ncbi:hypothetical protein [Cecembia rubra]|uniref:Uncharacterized protein n=1 Tax=Cecembia rubra TaxID=1485585 RepID=A0A2P8E329_9BACT|nr:hypothetical protein [Cecembia rubra]PSL03881.1 hypothetical protein CLV48_106121 [Cecembia rubra]
MEAILLEYKEKEHAQFNEHATRLTKKINSFLESWETVNSELKIDIAYPDLVKGIIEVGPALFERLEVDYLKDKDTPLIKHYQEFYYSKINLLTDLCRKITEGTIGMGNYPKELQDVAQWPWEADRLKPHEAWFSSLREHFELVASTKEQQELVDLYLALKNAYNALHEFSDSKGLGLSHDIRGMYNFHHEGLQFRISENFDLLPLHRL